jgi:hypothetical protein
MAARTVGAQQGCIPTQVVRVMLTVACLDHMNYLGRGVEYVAILRASVARHMVQPYRFVCLTDEPKRHNLPQDEIQYLPRCDKLSQLLTGWWAKLYLFEPGRFNGRVLYLDLDSAIVGPLDPLVAQPGAIWLRDWGWDRDVTAGGQLVWDAGEHSDLWEGAETAPKRFKDDQEYITARGGWPRMPAHLVRSYRYHCKAGVPAGASVIAFHGLPKPHELPPVHWVRDYWH